MTEILDKTLKQMYDEYLRTGDAEWMNINTPIANHLENLMYVTTNTQGESKLTEFGIQYCETNLN